MHYMNCRVINGDSNKFYTFMSSTRRSGHVELVSQHFEVSDSDANLASMRLIVVFLV